MGTDRTQKKRWHIFCEATATLKFAINKIIIIIIIINLIT